MIYNMLYEGCFCVYIAVCRGIGNPIDVRFMSTDSFFQMIGCHTDVNIVTVVAWYPIDDVMLFTLEYWIFYRF